MAEEDDWQKLPLDDRCVHKIWKARVHGYEECCSHFRRITDEKSPEWNKFAPLLKKFVTDSNAVAQEKGLEAALAYLESANPKIAAKTVSEVVSGVVAKCLGAPKAKTRENGMAVALMYVELEKPDLVMEELLKGTSVKNPKVASASVATLNAILHDFGPKVVQPLKPLVKAAMPLLEDRDKNVRDETKRLLVELFRWIGEAIRPQLQGLKPVQVAELEAEFDRVKTEGGVPQPTRYLRSEMEKVEAGGGMEVGAGPETSGPGVPTGAVMEVDPLDLIDPVEILSKLPKDFYERCEAKKWSERKDALEVLLPLAQNPKLVDGDYGELVKQLKKMVGKDTNVVNVALATQCLMGLARGLKKKFSPFASSCLSVILEKFKEKKINVVTALREAIDHVSFPLSLDQMQEDLLQALENKNPSIKAETASFLARIFATRSPTTYNKKVIKAYATALVSTANEPDPTVRDNSCEALGVLLRANGEKNVSPFISDMEALKMAKVKEYCEKAELKFRAAGPAAAPVASSSAMPPAAASSRPPPGGGARVVKPGAGGAKRPGVAGAAAKRKPGPAPSAAASSSAPAASTATEREITLEEAEGQLEGVIPNGIGPGLTAVNWKERLAAMESFLDFLRNSADPSTLPCQAMVLFLAQKKPGLRENNFQILKLKLEFLTLLASKGKFSTAAANHVLQDVVEE
ncbi:unnamed protein product, partial [Cyprideis torosa]